MYSKFYLLSFVERELKSEFVSIYPEELTKLKEIITEISTEGIKLSLLNDFTDIWISLAEGLRQKITGADSNKTVLNNFETFDIWT